MSTLAHPYLVLGPLNKSKYTAHCTHTLHFTHVPTTYKVQRAPHVFFALEIDIEEFGRAREVSWVNPVFVVVGAVVVMERNATYLSIGLLILGFVYYFVTP